MPISDCVQTIVRSFALHISVNDLCIAAWLPLEKLRGMPVERCVTVMYTEKESSGKDFSRLHTMRARFMYSKLDSLESHPLQSKVNH